MKARGQRHLAVALVSGLLIGCSLDRHKGMLLFRARNSACCDDMSGFNISRLYAHQGTVDFVRQNVRITNELKEKMKI